MDRGCDGVPPPVLLLVLPSSHPGEMESDVATSGEQRWAAKRILMMVLLVLIYQSG